MEFIEIRYGICYIMRRVLRCIVKELRKDYKGFLKMNGEIEEELGGDFREDLG